MLSNTLYRHPGIPTNTRAQGAQSSLALLGGTTQQRFKSRFSDEEEPAIGDYSTQRITLNLSKIELSNNKAHIKGGPQLINNDLRMKLIENNYKIK